MIKILFVCHGNICRSPMAEKVMKHLVNGAGRNEDFEIASAAMRTDEIGSPMYRHARAEVEKHGISGDGHTARLMTYADYEYYDLIVGMDAENKRDVMMLTQNDPQDKFRLLMSFAGEDRPVADPWYTRDFSTTYEDVLSGCSAMMASC